MSEPRTNTDSICRKLCPTTEEGQLQHSEECAFVCGLIARCDQLKVEVERYYGDLCHIVEIIGKVSPEAAPYAVGHVQAYVNKANDELEQARTGIESQRARAEKAEKDRDSAILERDNSWQRRKIAQAERDTARAEVDALRVAFALAEKYRDAATTAVKAASVTYRNADDMVPAWIAAALERDRDKAYAERDAAVATVGARKALSDAWRAEADKLAAAIRFEIAVGVAGIGTRGRLLRALELYQETLK